MTPLEEARALADGYVPETAIAAGIAEATVTRDYPHGFGHPTLAMRKGKFRTAAEPGPAPSAPLSCTVDGVAVAELAVLIKPVAFFVTTEHGTHEVSRCYFQGGQFKYGVDMTRLGGVSTLKGEYFPDRGLLIHFQHGYKMFVPVGHCQATWRLPS